MLLMSRLRPYKGTMNNDATVLLISHSMGLENPDVQYHIITGFRHKT